MGIAEGNRCIMQYAVAKGLEASWPRSGTVALFWSPGPVSSHTINIGPNSLAAASISFAEVIFPLDRRNLAQNINWMTMRRDGVQMANSSRAILLGSPPFTGQPSFHLLRIP